jgi:hypothetical protein
MPSYRTRVSALAAALTVSVAALPALAAPCPKDELGASATRIEKDGVAIAYRTIPAKIEVGKPFRIEVVACHGKTAPTRIAVDAGMPMHGHGMNYKPSEKTIAPGHSEFDGLVFHMPGSWTITFDIFEGSSKKRMEQKVMIRR